ncbi:DNA excision repair protein ERCC-1, partial [Onychostruthus taczanowskii]|uniref:DNA excision repair protein ERCC-1 n=1 Tax=Onychostruthus taczanowskii TaxID=356909 RepID=UPI001B800B88
MRGSGGTGKDREQNRDPERNREQNRDQNQDPERNRSAVPVPSLFRASAAPPPGPVPVPVLNPPGPGSYAEFVMRGSGGTGKDREQNRDPERNREQNRDQNQDPERNREQNRDRDPGPTGTAPSGPLPGPPGPLATPGDQDRDQNREQNRDRDPGPTGTAPSGPLPGPPGHLATPGDRDRDQNRDQNREQNRDREEPRAPPALGPGAKSSGIIVSPRQRGNPVLRFIRSVPWHFGDIGPDFVLGAGACALFLSLRYHRLHPEYIHERLRALGRGCGLRVLLLQVDVRDPHQSLKDLAKVCLLTDCTLLLAW